MNQLSNAFGGFSQDGRSYVIRDPATPAPWCNVICNGRYGLVVSQRGGGFSWFDDAQHNVLTRWEMDLVRDCYGKFLYLSDLASGEVWSVSPAPCNTRHDAYECVHEPGVTTFRTRAHDIESTWSLVVSEDEAVSKVPDAGVEVWGVTLRNAGKEARKLRVSSYFEWTCGVAPDVKREFHKLFFTTRHDEKRRAIFATKNMWDIPGLSEKEHWNVPWPYVAAHAVSCNAFTRTHATADKATFLGRYGSTANPAMMRGEPASKGFGRFGDASAALGGELVLQPGQSVQLHFVIVIAKDEAGATALLDAHQDPACVQRILTGARSAWTKRFSPTHVQSASDGFDVLTNTWLPYQAISARIWGRTGYYQQSGARGYRDQLQDSQVWLPVEPTRCAEQIMLHASRMFRDGSVNHWWHALANFGNHTECSDDYLWLAFVTASYLRETGDFAILQRSAGFLDSSERTSLLDHCTRAIERSFVRMSARGLPLIGSCDWNDGLSALGLAGKGESVWLGMFLCDILREWRVIYARAGDQGRAELCETRRAALVRAIEAHAWDGAHYRAATKDNGEWVGATSSPEGKIHLNAQTWSILAGVAPADRAAAAWKSVREKLLTPYGPLLLAPAYTKPDPDIGYITRYSPGSRENGGVYMHAATWALACACAVRDAASVGQIWNSIAPPVRSRDAEAYVAEPYVLPGNVDGPLGETPGRAGWTWYTGSAAWLRRVCLEWVLGVRPVWAAGGEGLLVDPVPPAELGNVSFSRQWRSWRVWVEFDAREFSAQKRAQVEVQGAKLSDSILSEALCRQHAQADGSVRVRVRWQ